MKNIFTIVLIWIVYSSNMIAQDIVHLKNYFRDIKTVDIFIEGKRYNFLFDTGGGIKLQMEMEFRKLQLV